MKGIFMKRVTIQQDQNSNIYAIASSLCDRIIEFRGQTKYALVQPAYLGLDNYTTSCSVESILKKAQKNEYGTIIDSDGNCYANLGDDIELLN